MDNINKKEIKLAKKQAKLHKKYKGIKLKKFIKIFEKKLSKKYNDYEVVEMDGLSFSQYCNYNTKRLNLYIKLNKINKITIG